MVHCLPHQAVIKKDRETTKLRIVFDAASKAKNDLSFNDPIRFRISKYSLVANLKQAFLQICLNKEHPGFVRFYGSQTFMTLTPKLLSYDLHVLYLG